ncbi:MAG TPA: PilZ domain-containing protein [Thermoanaerobaculia bacterium]|nr:PilZ domain-containing protein [Thermoanaerobaculia bacterium]
MPGRERREFQRLHLAEPVEARFGERPVRLVEIGISGARLEHLGRSTPGSTGKLAFAWESEQVEIDVEIVRCVSLGTQSANGEGLHHSGVLFLGATEGAGDALRRAISSAVVSRLTEQKLQGPPPDLYEFDETLRPGDAMFLTYTLDDGVWRKRRAFLPEQPEVGFTVALDEDKDELQRLCRAYEQADREGRRLLRLFCELSISDAMNVPRQR